MLLSVGGGKWWLLGDVEALCRGRVVLRGPGAVGCEYLDKDCSYDPFDELVIHS